MSILTSEEFYAKNYDYYENEKSEKASYMEAVNSFVAKNFEDGPILDVGCGDGMRALKVFSEYKSDIVGLDSCLEMCEKANQNGIKNVLYENIISPSENMMSRFQGCFGTILCLWNVLGHIIHLEDRERAVRNMSELLTTRGILFVDVNNRLNMDQYGFFHSMRNGILGIFQKKKGIFMLPINNLITQVYLSTRGEFIDLLNSGGLCVERVIYINYRDGVVVNNPLHGQMLAVCRKRL